MRVELKEIATVQAGYSFRSGLESSANGSVAVVQMKDLSADGTVDCKGLARVEMGALKEHQLVRSGDLIFRSRGLVSTSAILLEDPGIAVVAAPLLRVRVTRPDLILAGYLNWYIGQRDAQVFLSSRAKGTAQKMISKNAVESLEICLPSLVQQTRILELASLSVCEQRLIQAIAASRERYISNQLIKAAEGG